MKTSTEKSKIMIGKAEIYMNTVQFEKAASDTWEPTLSKDGNFTINVRIRIAKTIAAIAKHDRKWHRTPGNSTFSSQAT